MKFKNVNTGDSVVVYVGGVLYLAKVVDKDFGCSRLNVEIQFSCGKTSWVSSKDLKWFK